MHLGPIKLLYYYSNPAKTSPKKSQSVPMRVLVGAVRPGHWEPTSDSQSVPMGVLVGAGGVGHALGAN